MAFPQDRLPITAELQLAGVWTDITSYVYSRDQIAITRGRSAEGSQVDPGRCALTIKNRDGRFTPKNAMGAYYGAIGRNTPLRVAVRRGTQRLLLDGVSANYASTPDAVALDITGDIDLRVEGELNWYDAGHNQFLIAKWDGPGNQRSYGLRINQGVIYFVWSTTGSDSLSAAVELPAGLPRHAALRGVLDVNNGASGNTATFYWAPTLAGPWIQIGTPVVTAGTTSVFSSTAALQVGGADASTSPPRTPPIGGVWAAEVRNGIAGTVVASPNFAAQAIGVTTFADSAGRTWSLQGTAAITDQRIRFTGEVSEWPAQWTTGGQDVWVQVQAAGILRRLSQGASPLQSPMRREFTNPARTHIIAYWPMEDGANAASFGSTIPGARPLQITMPGVTPAASSSWTPSAPLPTTGAGTLTGPLPTYAITGQTALRMFVQLPAGGVSGPTRLISLKCTGTARTWTLFVNSSAQIALRAYEADGTQVLDTGYVTYSTITNGSQCSLGLELTQSGADVNWRVVAYDVTGRTVLALLPGTVLTGTLTAHTVQRVTATAVGEDGGLGATVVGHIAIADDTTAYGNTSGALVAWTGETVRSRVVRLCSEEGVSVITTGTGGDLMGPQRIDTLLNLLQQAADIGGTLYEQREQVGLAFRCRDADYNQTATLALDYTADGEVAPPLTPTDDDQQTRNDITVTRDQGAVARATLDTGALSTAAPPNGVGRYDSSATLNLYSDDQPAQHANWRLALGTWDGTRYPQLTVDLAAGPHLIDTATLVDINDRLTVDNTPIWLPPDLVELLALGYTETLSQYTWVLRYNCGPAGPWNVATLDDAVYGRADTDGSELAAAASSAATSLLVATTTSGPIWTTDPAEMPIPVRVSGEVVNATAIASSAIDTFARTVSSSWGTTDTGQTWTNTGGTAADFSVSSSSGRHSQGSLNTRRWSTFPMVTADFDARVNFATSAFPAGDNQFAFMVGRFIDTNNCYMVRAQLALTTGAISLSIRKRVGGTETDLGTVVTGVTFAAGTVFWIRFRAQGTALAAKVWPGTSPEPDWQNRVTDSDLTAAGSIGVVSQLGSASTNTLPVTFFWDSFEVLNPQTFTVTRSVNGVVKALPSGADVRLAYPAVAAL